MEDKYVTETNMGTDASDVTAEPQVVLTVPQGGGETKVFSIARKKAMMLACL